MKIFDDIKNIKEELPEGERVIFTDKGGRIRRGTVRIKAVRCGKPTCKKCPHKIYAYAQYRVGKRVLEKYLGIAR